MVDRYLRQPLLYYVCQACRSYKAQTPSLTYCRRRELQFTAAQRRREEKPKLIPDPPLNPRSDWIGPPHPISNIRPYKFYIPDDETDWQREFRLRREDTRKWNHEFWLEHNNSFFKKKNEFVKRILEEKRQNGEKDETTTTLSPEEMSEFYRKFLDDKYKIHMQYNKDWYMRNISLLWPALKVSLEKLWKRKSKSSG